MLMLRCILSLSDGRLVEGKVEALWPGTDYHLHYSGEIGLLTMHPARGTPADLELVFRMASYQKGASLHVDRQGEYESKASQPHF